MPNVNHMDEMIFVFKRQSKLYRTFSARPLPDPAVVVVPRKSRSWSVDFSCKFGIGGCTVSGSLKEAIKTAKDYAEMIRRSCGQ